MQKTVDLINDNQIDIISLAEIEKDSWRNKNKSHLTYLQRGTGLKYAKFFSTHKMGKFINQGNAILSKFPITSAKNIKLPGKGEARYLSLVEINIHGQRVVYATTHLSVRRKKHLKQIDFISGKLTENKLPVILAGDFNTTKKELNNFAEKEKMQEVKTLETFPSWRPVSKMDHIFIDNKLQIKEEFIFSNNVVSDHLSIGAEVFFNDLY